MTTPNTFPPPLVDCPYCGQRTGVRILRGLPGPEAQKAAGDGRVVLGGCLVGPYSTDWLCKSCRYEWRD